MTSTEDDDLKLLRASASILSDLENCLLSLIQHRKAGAGSGNIRTQIREVDMYRTIALIEPFQEDPQLLDSHLKKFIPPLVDAYLATLRITSRPKVKKGYVPISHAICQIFNLFCKVRGEKILKGFLNNEPRFLEPILLEFERGDNLVLENGSSLPASITPWKERYVLLLWLSHLMLAPFPLASMSSLEPSQEVSTKFGVELPSELPEIALRVLVVCIEGLKSATKERSAAANLLVRLCVRPDMQDIGLLSSLIKWSLSFFSDASADHSDIHKCLGVLSFLSGLVTSATNEEIGPFLSSIYQVCQTVISTANLSFIKSSAVARKQIIKIFRNIVVHSLRPDAIQNALDTTSVIEEVIEFLLEAVGDGDSPVRYAASKALSIVTMKLEPEMAGDVVEAILGSLNENVYWQGSKRNLSGVNPLQWHGCTLTLSHLLYQRALSTAQLPDILNALLLALAFEQRSATGGSIGTNVRDAACFGIWALSRRYTTKDLLAVETTSVRASEHFKSISILQVLAIELLVVACLDPAGNIRRGSSAALQELIGRNPNTVEEGISLVQIVDFHAVGLRDRAMQDVAIKAASLHPTYWEALFDNLLTWRGIGSLDATSREYAAFAVRGLSRNQPAAVIKRMADGICERLAGLKAREIEERQGFVLSLANILDGVTPNELPGAAIENQPDAHTDRANLTYLWDLFEDPLNLEDKSFTSPMMRPEYTASSVCYLLGSLAAHSHSFTKNGDIKVPTREVIRLLNLCLGRHEDSVMEAIPRAASRVLGLLRDITTTENVVIVNDWLARLENEASYNGLRCSGFAIALGAAYPVCSDSRTDVTSGSLTSEQIRIVEVLTFRCTSGVAIEARIVALKAIEVLLKSHRERSTLQSLPGNVHSQIVEALHLALNDYTVTERGDVGALVRFAALSTSSTAWNCGLVEHSETDQRIYSDVLRLSLEKLDKVRARAAQVLERAEPEHSKSADNRAVEGVSSYAHFSNALARLKSSTPFLLREDLLLGFISSAGMGSESVVRNSRAALLDAVELLPTSSTKTEELTLLDIANCFTDLLKKSLDIERILIPLMDVIAFLFDMQVMHRLIDTNFSFRNLLSLTQKAHFKSTHMQKLLLALDLYRGLGAITSTRADTLTKVTNMLLHPFPRIRITAAETLWLLTQEDGLKRHDWSLPPKGLKPAVDIIKREVAVKVVA
ncbi:tubulin folding cofactor D C terminal-domain-containing protein [Dendryphion nanum]|uniref:Tubulin folding cofactor D C terminal-domain-containing protein n=1 Tax=Dendryphion nanum TaxID=256645 RepID=A0A9P9ICP9_9PLEO|nr:tubulin folding cofactor D C terminal-domain-containing protein [Dendryphion nanum]